MAHGKRRRFNEGVLQRTIWRKMSPHRGPIGALAEPVARYAVNPFENIKKWS